MDHAALEETKRFFVKVYGWMFLALMITAGIAFYVSQTPSIYSIIIGSRLFFFGLIIAQLGFVIWLAGFIKKMSANLATILFLLYSATVGLTTSIIFLIYTTESIGFTFVVAAGMFGVMSIYGFITKTDLTAMGNLLFMALIGLIIASLANFWLQNPIIYWITAYAGVVIFTGLTAYDTQKIKKMNIIGNEGTDEDRKEAILGALRLYLDFINLFLHLLRIMGKRR